MSFLARLNLFTLVLFMTKLFSIFFSMLILIQSLNIGFEDISKIDDLIEHATFHKEIHGDSFIDFIVEHYAENFTNHDEDHEEHDNLPFKHDSNSFQNTVPLLTVSISSIELRLNPEIQLRSHFFYEDLYSFLNNSSVFQPPKQA